MPANYQWKEHNLHPLESISSLPEKKKNATWKVWLIVFIGVLVWFMIPFSMAILS